ncbi:MAG: ATP-binding protein [Thermomicrobiales bacterium]
MSRQAKMAESAETHHSALRIPHSALLMRLGAVVLATAVASVLAFLWVGARERDLLEVALFMLCSGLLSVALGWALAYGAWQRRVGLRIALISISALGPLFVLVNVAFTARLMFFNTHDLGLLAVLLLFALTPGIAVSTLLGGRIAGAVDSLGAGAAAMARGDLTTRVRADGVAELRALAESFNSMAAQLEAAARERAETERARRDLIAAVSHDLRTPLASLRALAEALDDGVVDDPEGIRRYLRLMTGETERLNMLIDDLFELARLESGALRLDRTPSPVQDLISEALERMTAQAGRKGLQLAGEVIGDPPPVLIDGQQVTRVLLNLVQNAIRHTPADGSVTLRAARAEDGVLVEVRDTGEGIGADDLPRVFDRFYRGDPARTREAGAGLGLAIARGIVEAHGGRIWVESAPGQGTLFAFTLPAA